MNRGLKRLLEQSLHRHTQSIEDRRGDGDFGSGEAHGTEQRYLLGRHPPERFPGNDVREID
ncbi:hypothetical protein HJB79_28765 [Rhizobium lentis]|nr:hypothetical protein [Rhizobium lentis]MBX5142714.1 hypothetical protein [Rhizobium lentis]MBX5154636.1 hypothetical protein [Rhizobium lentis]MBX5179955.1 hypothetical protein [Rhizobium lentis]